MTTQRGRRRKEENRARRNSPGPRERLTEREEERTAGSSQRRRGRSSESFSSEVVEDGTGSSGLLGDEEVTARASEDSLSTGRRRPRLQWTVAKLQAQ